MKDNKKVSVIISLYGYKYSNNLEAVIKSINEQTIDTEVIVSEQGENVSSVFKGIAKKWEQNICLPNQNIEMEK